MKNDLVETVKYCFTSGVTAQLSALVDETEPNTRKAINKAVPLVLKGLLNRVERGFSAEVLSEMAHAAATADVLRQLATPYGWNGSDAGTNLLYDLLGDNYRATISQVALGADIRPGASSMLTQVAATAVLGVLGKVTLENNFSPGELTDWLRAQNDAVGSAVLKDAIAAALVSPARPALLAEPGRPLPPQSMGQAPAEQAVARVPKAGMALSPAPESSTGLRWQWGALLLLAVCMGYFVGRGYIGDSASTNAAPGPGALAGLAPGTSTDETNAGAAPARAPGARSRPVSSSTPDDILPGRYDKARDRYIYDTGKPVTLTLANGTKQVVGVNSTENRLFTFLNSPEQVDSVNRTKGWINLDRVNFEPSKALLTPESAVQLGNLARILNSFPNTVVKIGGYTDSTGDAKLNYELSDQRAHAAMLALARRGVSPSRLQAKGYGPRYFVRPNNTPANRALNRRVSIRVVQK